MRQSTWPRRSDARRAPVVDGRSGDRIATRRSAVSVAADAVGNAQAQSIAQEAAWLYKGGWPLYALVDKYATNAPLDEETNCLATAVYFEARGESLEGQLAVAHVVMNRASSGRYPPDWCGVVKQPAQFSFVRHGEFPYARHELRCMEEG